MIVKITAEKNGQKWVWKRDTIGLIIERIPEMIEDEGGYTNIKIIKEKKS